MKTNFFRSFLGLPVLVAILMTGCESIPDVKEAVHEAFNAPNANYIPPEAIAETKDQAMQWIDQLPTAEEVANPSRTSAPVTTRLTPELRPETSSADVAPVASVPFPENMGSPVVSSSSTGRIALVNQKKGFAIVDFQKNDIPPMGSKLGVYRNGQLIGSITLTPPSKPPMVSADILSGGLLRGDTVR